MRLILSSAIPALLLLSSIGLASPLEESVNGKRAGCLQCKPFPTPRDNSQQCDQSTTCVGQPGGRNYCACRGGYRGDGGYRPGDTSVQFRLNTPGQQGRVFISPGASCNTLCDKWFLGKDGCQEVGLRADC